MFMFGYSFIQVRDEALKCIMQWGISFKDKRDQLPVFFETFVALKASGATFPDEGPSAPVFTPPPAMFEDEQPPPSGGSKQSDEAKDEAELAKLKDDLCALSEKIKLCREMLPESPGIELDETLSEVSNSMCPFSPKF